MTHQERRNGPALHDKERDRYGRTQRVKILKSVSQFTIIVCETQQNKQERSELGEKKASCIIM